MIKIDKKIIKNYLQQRLRTEDIQIGDIISDIEGRGSHEKMVIIVFISGKKYCMKIRRENMRYTQAAMRAMGGSVPKVLFFDRSKKHFPYEVMVMEYIDAPTLRQSILDNKKIDFFSLGRCLRKFHKTRIQGLPFSSYNLKVIESLKKLSAQFPHLCREIMRTIQSSPSEQNAKVVSHNDLSTLNILNNNGFIFLDLDGIAYNSKEFDLAYLLHRIKRNFIRAQQPKIPDDYLINYAKANPADLINQRQKILKEFTGLSRKPGPESIKSFESAREQLLEGYGHPVSKNLLCYYNRLLQLARLQRSLSDIIDHPHGKEEKMDLIKVLIKNDVVLSRNTTQELINYIATF
ncbi:MAG: phosphotransferase [Candidatus Omnitrophota bacterium]